MNFEEIIEDFRQKEQIEDALCLIGKDDLADGLRKLAVAWGKIRINRTDRTDRTDKTNKKQSENEIWNELWDQVEYDFDEIKKISGVRIGIEQKMDILIGNRIIYPDGTINSFGAKAIKQMLKSQLNL
jgi:hypothetical protein